MKTQLDRSDCTQFRIVLFFTKHLLIPATHMVIDLTFVCSYNTIGENKLCWLFSTRS